MAGRAESQIMEEEKYREYICREVYKNKECGFKVQAKTEEEAMEHALKHREEAHGVTEMSPEMERGIREEIRPVSAAEEYEEYACPECGFAVRARSEDEIIEHAHMHQELEHGVTERSPEMERHIRQEMERPSEMERGTREEARSVSAAEGYKEYYCPECGFAVRAKTEDEIIERAHMHQEMEHGVKEMSPEMERGIRREIRPVSATEEYKEYTCPECGFTTRAKDEDELIEHAHMHQELEHGVKEWTPAEEKKIVAHVTPVTIL